MVAQQQVGEVARFAAQTDLRRAAGKNRAVCVKYTLLLVTVQRPFSHHEDEWISCDFARDVFKQAGLSVGLPTIVVVV